MSTRAFSRKNRVYAMREFILLHYGTYLNPSNHSQSDEPKAIILDVAGGKGVLSWLFCNMDGYDSIVIDPRRTDYSNLMKSVTYLLTNPKEAEERCQPHLPTFQPLAACLKQKMCKDSQLHPFVPVLPRHLRIYVDDALIQTIDSMLLESIVTSSFAFEVACDENQNQNENENRNWEIFIEKAIQKSESTCPIYGKHQYTKTEPQKSTLESNTIVNPNEAYKIFQMTKLIVGFHPDQATEACIDLALLLKIPFVVCPCCVFPSEFPNRFLHDTIYSDNNDNEIDNDDNDDFGIHVRTYTQLIQYLQRKHPKIRTERIDMKSDTARNIVLYMMPEDFM